MIQRIKIEIWKVDDPGIFFPIGVIGGVFWTNLVIHLGEGKVLTWPKDKIHTKYPSKKLWTEPEINSVMASMATCIDTSLNYFTYKVIWNGTISHTTWNFLMKVYESKKVLRTC